MRTKRLLSRKKQDHPKTTLWSFQLKKKNLRVTKLYFGEGKSLWTAYIEDEKDPEDFGVNASGKNIRSLIVNLRREVAIASDPRIKLAFKRLEKR